MNELGKLLMLLGLGLVLFGLLVWGLGKVGFRGLPGDVRYEGERIRFFFPIVTCLVASALLTVVVTLISLIWRWWQR